MKGRARRRNALAALAVALLAATAVLGVSQSASGGDNKGGPATGCSLDSKGNKIQHVVSIVFDNTHYMRDRPNVASDLEQMPHLLNFLTDNGTLLTNDHTGLISHTAGGILSGLTGLYPDRQGQTVSNSYFYFDPSGVPTFSSSFKYWLDLVDDATGAKDPLPNMVTDGQKTTPAPWVPFTRAGCDWGGVSTANAILENTGTGTFGDMTEVFGAGSPEWNEAAASNAAPSGTAARAKALTDFIGIGIHCAQGGGICTSNAANVANSRADKLPDEPGGYSNYLGLFGAKYANPAICAGSLSTGCTTLPSGVAVNDTSGAPITDPFGQAGFPGFDGMSAKVTLGYVAQMQEAGVPVTYAYISDAHDNHTSSFPAPFNPNFPRASGPGEADYVQQLHDYDQAFATFFQRLENDGITKKNTLFTFTVDEGDHYAGGVSSDGTWSHTFCNVTAGQTCPANQIGEVNLNLNSVLPSGEPPYTVHNDSAPTFYVNGNPPRDNPALRKLERDAAAAQAVDPYISMSPTPLMAAIADTVGEKALHMINTDPRRTMNFTLFANPDYFIKTSNTNCGGPIVADCIDYHFAWSHGDIQPEIATTWLGVVGPGVEKKSIDDQTWADHTDLRPTILTLLGLKDSYETDGRTLTQILKGDVVPKSLDGKKVEELGAVYKQLDAPFGEFGQNILVASTNAVKSGSTADDSKYTSVESQIQSLTSQRDALADQIRTGLNNAEFNNVKLDKKQVETWIKAAQSLIDQSAALAASSS
jgi:hypothetical protein